MGVWKAGAKGLGYIPSWNLFIYACEGNGSNLDQEDLDNGYVDYIYYSIYIFEDGEFIENDGGMLLLNEYFVDLFPEGQENKLMEYVIDCLALDSTAKQNHIILSDKAITKDLEKQYEFEAIANSHTEYGEPQHIIYLDNGRSVEITHEKYGLNEETCFFSARLHCSDEEYDCDKYYSSVGVIDTIFSKEWNTQDFNIDSITKWALSHESVEEITAEEDGPDPADDL